MLAGDGIALRNRTVGNLEHSGHRSTTDNVKDIGRRQTYDILQSRKPRLQAGRYGKSGFREA